MSFFDKKAIVDFDSENLSVMSDGILLKRIPCAVVRKKSETPVLIAYGKPAEKKKANLASNEMFCKPFSKGKVADEAGAKLLFKAALREVFGNNPFVSVYVLISGGLSEHDKQEIKYVVTSAGYGKVYLVPRPRVLATVLAGIGLHAGLYMDNDLAEFVLAGDDLLTSHVVDASLTAVAENLSVKLLTDDKLVVSATDSLHIVQTSLSLFKEDLTPVICAGRDAITVSEKKVFFTAKDLYPLCESTYSKITALIDAALMDTEKDFALDAAQKGILCLGEGSHFEGFTDYFYQILGITPLSHKNDFLLLSTAQAMVDRELL